jgi:O-antigen ligase
LKIVVIAAAPALGALLLWAILDLENFVLFAVLGTIVFPASLAKPFGTNVDAADILLLIALSAWLVSNSLGRAPDPWIRRNSLWWPAMFYLTVNAASIAWSVKPRSTLFFAVQLTELIVLFPIIMATIPQSTRKIRTAFSMVIVLTCGQAVWSLLVYFSNHSARISGTYLPGLNKNALGSFLAAGLVIAFARWVGSSGARRHWLVPAMALLLAGTVASGSRGALLGAGAAIITAGVLLGHRRLFTVLLAVTIIVLYVGVIVPEQAAKTRVAGSYNSSVIRSAAWAATVKKIEHQPWLGTGARTFSATLREPLGTIIDPDNLFLLTWAELGIPGMLTLGFLLFRIGQLTVRSRHLPRDAAALAVGAGGVALSVIVHSLVDISWVRGQTTLEFAMIGLMLAINRIDRESAAADSSSEVDSTQMAEPPPLQLTGERFAAVGRHDPSRLT